MLHFHASVEVQTQTNSALQKSLEESSARSMTGDSPYLLGRLALQNPKISSFGMLAFGITILRGIESIYP